MNADKLIVSIIEALKKKLQTQNFLTVLCVKLDPKVWDH